MSQAQSSHTPARYYALFCHWLEAAGHDVESILAAARLDSESLHQPRSEISVRQIESLVRRASEITGRTDLGFEFGRQIKPSSHDILGFAIISSPTLDHALRIAARFYSLITLTFRLRYTRRVNEVVLDFIPALALSPEALRFHIEGIAFSVHEQFKLLLGDKVPPYAIYGFGEAPEHRDRYRLFAPAHWHFGARTLPGVTMNLPLEMVDRPLAMADSNALKMAEERCEALLQRVAGSGELSQWIAMMLREARDSMPGLEDFARILHITPRTLERRLRREDKQFSQILAEVRLEKASALLCGGRHPVTEIAYQLGYKDVANFTRAFKRQTGLSPSQFRQARSQE